MVPRAHALARPGLERGTIERPWKPFTAAPDADDAAEQERDEIIEVRFPAAVVVAQEQQRVTPRRLSVEIEHVDQRPVREVDGLQPAQTSRRDVGEQRAIQQLEEEQRVAHAQPVQPAALQHDEARHVIRDAEILQLLQLAKPLASFVIFRRRRVAPVEPSPRRLAHHDVGDPGEHRRDHARAKNRYSRIASGTAANAASFSQCMTRDGHCATGSSNQAAAAGLPGDRVARQMPRARRRRHVQRVSQLIDDRQRRIERAAQPHQPIEVIVDLLAQRMTRADVRRPHPGIADVQQVRRADVRDRSRPAGRRLPALRPRPRPRLGPDSQRSG